MKQKRPKLSGTPRVSAEKKAKFLEVYGETCSVNDAAAAIGVHRITVWKWAQADPEFQRQWAHTRGTLVAEGFEEEAVRRGVRGIEKPVYYQGVWAGEWVDSNGLPVAKIGDGIWAYPDGSPVPPEFGVQYRRATVREYSDTMLAMLLNGALPHKYQRLRHEHTGGDGGPIATVDVTDHVEIARRVAFALAQGLALARQQAALPEQRTIEHERA